MPEDFALAVEAVLAEAERHAAWTAELEAEVAAARQRRAQLAGSLERLMHALGPEAARAYLPRLAAITEAPPPRPQGRLAPDGRLAALKEILADWPEETIATRAATEALRARGLPVEPRYAANRFKGMAARGLLVPCGTGRYRIVRTHPEMVELGVRQMGERSWPEAGAWENG